MSIVGPWAIAVYKGKVNWGAVPVPTSTGKPAADTYTFGDAKNVGLYTACKNQATAWDVLKFATGEEHDKSLLTKTGQMPMRANLQQAYPDYFTENPAYTQFGDQAARVVEVPGGPHTVEMLQTLRDAYTKAVVSGEGDLQQALERGRREGNHPRRSVGKVEMATVTTLAPASAPAPRGGRGYAGSARGRDCWAGCSVPRTWSSSAVIFAFPLGFAVYMSVHDYFFTAPGRERGPAIRRDEQLRRRR